MLRKRSTILVSAVSTVAIIFGISYMWAFNKYNTKDDRALEASRDNDKSAVISNIDGVLSSNTKIVLRLRSKENKSDYTAVNLTVGDLHNEVTGELTLRNIQDYYKNKEYSLVSASKGKIVFMREISYEPSKYYLGITKDGFVAIFTCDKEGNLTIDDPVEDISNIMAKDLPKENLESLKNFQYKFDNKDEAKDELASLSS